MKIRHFVQSTLVAILSILLLMGCSNQTKANTNQNDSESTSGEAEETQEKESNVDTSLDELPDISQIPLDSGETVLLSSDENMDLSFVSADATNGIVFEVNNKTDKNLKWQYDSIALNKRSINAQDFYISSGDIAPNSSGQLVVSFQYDVDTSKYDWSEGITSVSGQFKYFIGDGFTNMVSVNVSNVSV